MADPSDERLNKLKEMFHEGSLWHYDTVPNSIVRVIEVDHETWYIKVEFLQPMNLVGNINIRYVPSYTLNKIFPPVVGRRNRSRSRSRSGNRTRRRSRSRSRSGNKTHRMSRN
jgi:hypothetical protein